MATKKICPRADGEGSLGKAAARWGDVQTDALNGQAVNDDGLASTAGFGLLKTATAATIATGTATDEAVTPDALDNADINLGDQHKLNGRQFGNFKVLIYDDSGTTKMYASAVASGGGVASPYTGGLSLSTTPTAVVAVGASHDFQNGLGVLASATNTLVLEVPGASYADVATVDFLASVSGSNDADGLFGNPGAYYGDIGGVTAYWPTLKIEDANGTAQDLTSIASGKAVRATFYGHFV